MFPYPTKGATYYDVILPGYDISNPPITTLNHNMQAIKKPNVESLNNLNCGIHQHCV